MFAIVIIINIVCLIYACTKLVAFCGPSIMDSWLLDVPPSEARKKKQKQKKLMLKFNWFSKYSQGKNQFKCLPYHFQYQSSLSLVLSISFFASSWVHLRVFFVFIFVFSYSLWYFVLSGTHVTVNRSPSYSS